MTYGQKANFTAKLVSIGQKSQQGQPKIKRFSERLNFSDLTMKKAKWQPWPELRGVNLAMLTTVCDCRCLCLLQLVLRTVL